MEKARGDRVFDIDSVRNDEVLYFILTNTPLRIIILPIIDGTEKYTVLMDSYRRVGMLRERGARLCSWKWSDLRLIFNEDILMEDDQTVDTMVFHDGSAVSELETQVGDIGEWIRLHHRGVSDTAILLLLNQLDS